MASKTINPFTFLQQVRAETAKVTWPSRRETMISTIMVVVFAFIAAIFFFAADQLMGFGSSTSSASATRQRPRRKIEMTARWYIVHAYSNFEKKVAEDIEHKAKQKGLSDQIEQIVVPTEKVVEVRRGRKVDAERKFFPGYVLVRANLTDAVFSLIKNTPKVTGFLGDSKPVPITDKEAERILHQVQEGVERPKPSVTFEIGEQVRVSDGPFASFNGFVQEVDEERARLKVEVSIFGRAVPVDLEFGQVEKG